MCVCVCVCVCAGLCPAHALCTQIHRSIDTLICTCACAFACAWVSEDKGCSASGVGGRVTLDIRMCSLYVEYVLSLWGWVDE